LSRFIQEKTGIRTKSVMLEARVRRRLRALGIEDYGTYCDLVMGKSGADEIVPLLDEVTTNKTDFFREANHLTYLVEQVLPIMARRGVGTARELRVWSAGCSSGEEPYSIAMVLAEAGCRYSILATDICTEVLDHAQRAVYDLDRVDPVPRHLRFKYLLLNRGREQVRIIPELRAHVRFQRLNFLETPYELRDLFDVIFCRNVFIYFDRATQEGILHRFRDQLAPEGYIFLGHSESITGLNVPLVGVAPTIYQAAE
jgi:chemotaxis protein methyltransferase CheR